MSNADKPPDGYQVGYRRPPPEHQFKKGVSGNPSGRPRAKAPKPTNPGYAELDDILLAEALRPITVRENDEILEMPVMQAVVRSLGVQAIKGDRRSQLLLTSLVKAVQSERSEARVNIFAAAVDYKERCYREFEYADGRGQPRPDPVPHPDEIVCRTSDMVVKFNGPQSPDDKAHWDWMLQRKTDALEEIKYYQSALKKHRSGHPIIEGELEFNQRLVKVISANYPDVETRRSPGFDLAEWRERQKRLQDVLGDQARPRRRRRRAKS